MISLKVTLIISQHFLRVGRKPCEQYVRLNVIYLHRRQLEHSFRFPFFCIGTIRALLHLSVILSQDFTFAIGRCKASQTSSSLFPKFARNPVQTGCLHGSGRPTSKEQSKILNERINQKSQDFRILKRFWHLNSI